MSCVILDNNTLASLNTCNAIAKKVYHNIYSIKNQHNFLPNVLS